MIIKRSISRLANTEGAMEMTDSEREARIAEIQARRKERGLNDPLNRLSFHIERAIANGEKPIEGKDSGK